MFCFEQLHFEQRLCPDNATTFYSPTNYLNWYFDTPPIIFLKFPKMIDFQLYYKVKLLADPIALDLCQLVRHLFGGRLASNKQLGKGRKLFYSFAYPLTSLMPCHAVCLIADHTLSNQRAVIRYKTFPILGPTPQLRSRVGLSIKRDH